MAVELQEIAKALIAGSQDQVRQLVGEALKEGVAPQEILQKGLIAGMDEVGRRFKANEMFVPEVLLCARAMHAGMDVLKPVMVEGAQGNKEKVVIGTVKGDLHDIGKNLVIMMLEGAGFKVIDLGMNVSPEKFLEVFEAEKPAVIGMSAMLTTTMQAMRDTIALFEKQGQRHKVKFLVGGAPVTAEFANKIGADGYGADAGEALELVKEFTLGRSA
ncbi:Methionine synthase [Neomoorella glycerini]|uniref:Methionine synthase n=1 Tax=Neomoorella glycerini TaxID=55779 RepID=A0A6I5ZPD4_9FIRM|nr:corrinoid protein [Moorella glycerini]QGP91628.1 Methionine synthase [Moorella glycerini]